jgi:hypothetical protein
MAPHLLERQAELHALATAVVGAAQGRGSTVMVFGEAGIGKTSLMRAFQADLVGRARVLAGSCEDLLTPRALGPLRDAARSTAGPLAAALADHAEPDVVFSAVHQELTDPNLPTVLVVEDAHWSDGATLDVLRYVGRRVGDLPAVLASSEGRVEFDTVEEGREADILSRAMRTAELEVFRRRLSGFDFQPLLHRFDEGLTAETSDLTPAGDLLAQFGDLPGLSKLLDRLGVEEESPGVAASALEFVLEGLYLSRRLNKDGGDTPGSVRYEGPASG